jgi:hypothetical protein
VLELFGKLADDRATRLRGLPTHVAALNNELNPPAANAGGAQNYQRDEAQYRAVEQDSVSTLLSTAEAVNINFPPLAIIFPLLGRVVILDRKAGVLHRQEEYFKPEELNNIRATYRMEANALGPYYQGVPAYQNFPNFQGLPRWVPDLLAANPGGLADGYHQ